MGRKMLGKLKVGEKTYRVDNRGFITEYHRISEHKITTRTLNPSRKNLPMVVKISPPKPFKDWESYHRWLGE